MTDNQKAAKEFVKQFYKEMLSHKKSCTDQATANEKASLVSQLTGELNLSDAQRPIFNELIATLLTDISYTVLLGLDGEAAIGDRQQPYQIIDQDGNNLSGGEIEAYAYEYFHSDLYEKEHEK